MARFKCKKTEQIWNGHFVKGIAQPLQKQTYRKLQMLIASADLTDLLVPPGNRLETLSGDRLGQHSIRVNDQFRLCFIWTEDGAKYIELVDYH